MAAVKKKLLVNFTSVDIGCGSCRKSKSILSQIFRPKPKSPNSNSDRRLFRSPSSFSDKKLSDVDMSYGSEVVGNGAWKIGGVSVAVEKDSNDPYVDFRQSMLQMILENEIYTQEGLRELLSCFLHLNSPCNHGIIIRAFAEIWDGVSCGRSTADMAVPKTAARKQRRSVRSRVL
ncbi:Transcription repressor OFP6, partial [Cucurbita argyrosperma subsp. argyrosperma]